MFYFSSAPKRKKDQMVKKTNYEFKITSPCVKLKIWYN